MGCTLPLCEFPNCGREAMSTRPLCLAHRQQQLHKGELTPIASKVRRTGCLIEGCMGTHRAKGYCNFHYNRVLRGVPLGGPAPGGTRVTKEAPECSVEGCTRPAQAKGLCKRHHKRLMKHGDPSVVKVSGVDFNAKGSCSVDDCSNPHHAHGFCRKHLERWKKHGDPSVVLPITGRPLKGEWPSIHAVHKNLARRYGPASEWLCVDCGKAAREWSYTGDDPMGLTGVSNGFQMGYSLDFSNYLPRCVSCHRKFDHK